MHNIAAINWIAVLVTAFAGFVIGGLWYGPLFSKPWMKASGVATGNMSTAQSVRLFASAYVLNVVIAFALATLIGDNHTLLAGAHTGFFVSVMFIATALGVIYLFERRPLKLFFINAGYQVVNTTAMGAVLGIWPHG